MTLNDIVLLVREIQTLLASRSEPIEEELVDLASRHEEIVVAVSQRLESIERLLNQGLRTEAIGRAELEPNLNDVLTALDFPELGPWNELLESKEIQPVPVIPVEAAAELNDAYLATGSIEKLLQHYRSISLARAPLSKRIEALRRLVQNDGQNPVWYQDLREFETHRVKEMKQDLDQAIKSEDLTAVAEIDQELSGASWTIDVPTAICQQASKSHQSLRRKAALTELKTLSHQLSDAYADFDQPTAQRLQQRFLAVQGIAGIAVNHPLMDIAGPALDWLQEEARKAVAESDHKAAVGEIEVALDRKTTVDELEKLYHKATRHGHTLPQVLVTRIAERRDQLLSGARRTRILIMTATVAACLLGIAAVTIVVRTVSFNKAVAEHSDELGKLLASANQNGQLGPISDYLKQIEVENPAFATTPAILGLKQEFENLSSSEKGRRSQITQRLTSIQNVIDSNPALSDFPAAFSALDELKQLSKGEQEKAQFLQTEQQLTDRRGQVQKVVDDEFNQELTAASDEIARLPEDKVDPYDAVYAVLTRLGGRTDVSEPLKQSVTALQSKVQQDRQLVAGNLKMAAGLRKITDSVGQLTAFEQNLTQFIRDNPGIARSGELEKAIQSESAIWKSVGTWHLLRRRLKLADLTKLSAVEAAQLVADCEALQKSSGPFGDELLQTKMLTALKAIASRNTDGNQSIDEQIKNVLSRKTISRAYLLETKDGESYYADKPPINNKNSTLTFDYYTTTTGTQTTKKNLLYGNVVRANLKTNDDDWLSPQTKMYRRTEEFLKSSATSDYDTIVAGVIKEIVTSEDADALLRVLLVEELLTLGSKGSEGLRIRSEAILRDISNLGVSRLTNWAAPGDSRAIDERIDAKAFLARTQEVLTTELKKATEDTKAIQQSPLPPDLQWVGWLRKDSKSNWIVSLNPDISISGKYSKLCVFYVPVKAQTAVTHVVIGKMTPQSKLMVEVMPDSETGREGRPVYLLLEDDPK
jgi:HPt (histidine-containing phosphotransfer) domain-containing protein